MKQLVLSVLVFLGFIASSYGQQNSAPKFTITIRSWGNMFQDDDTWTITQNSIKAETYFFSQKNTPYSKALSQDEATRIYSYLEKIRITKLPSENVNNNAPDDKGEFTFKFKTRTYTKEIRIYVRRIESILQLVQELNKLLPKEMQIPYNEEYLKWDKTAANMGFTPAGQ